MTDLMPRDRPRPPELDASPSERRHGKRLDIQGLRAIAVGSVVLYHAGAPFLPGGYVGVDVFFVISGFVITAGLLRESLATGSISLGAFYGRRVRRIVPAATVVLVATGVATLAWLPATRWADIAREILGSAFYYVNWIFAAHTNYLNADDAASPLEHFWSLAVEEQFYILWPLLILVLLGLARRRPQSTRHLMGIGVLAVALPSLAWSVHLTSADPGAAYFVTTTRLWELAVGAGVAVAATRLARIPHRAGLVLGWAGLAAVVVACTTYSTATPFPGYAALLPTLGAAAIIVGGMGGRAGTGVGALLAQRPMTWLGDLSYSLYLWHWPMIVVGSYLLGGAIGFAAGLAIATASVLPAWLSLRFVEMPFQRWAPLTRSGRNTAAATALMMLASAAVALTIGLQVRAQEAGGIQDVTAGGRLWGAALLQADPGTGKPRDHYPTLAEGPLQAADDVADVYARGCHQEHAKVQAKGCVSGDPQGHFTIAVIGDSHAAQWMPAFELLGRQNGWKVVSYTKSQCPLSGAVIDLAGRPYTACVDWNRNVMDVVTRRDRPDLVVLSNTRFNAYPKPAKALGAPVHGSMADGYAWAYRTLRDAGLPVVVLADTPLPDSNVPECLSAHLRSMTRCSTPATFALANGGPDQRHAIAEVGDVPLIDLNPLICPGRVCSAVVGDVIVYRDSNHVSASYIETLAPDLLDRLRQARLVPPPPPQP